MNARNIVAALTIAIAVIAGLVGFTQCGKADLARLTRADSLLVAEEGDSAMMILQSIDSTDLTRSNNAYYALLYTQAQYKCYVPIESDSLINIAVRYYTNNYDQRKLTKALMYQGAVYAELKFNRLALDSYKEAEKVADTTDLMTVGLLNFRMGELYQNSYIDNDEPITRYKKAARYFNKVGHKAFEHYSYSYLGQMYIAENYDSAYYYINKVIDWVSKLEGEKQLLNSSRVHLAKLYWHHQRDQNKRKELLLNVYRDRELIVMGSDVFHHLADVYCKLGIIDSAKYFAAQFPQPEQLVDSMSYHMMLESLAIAQNDYKTAHGSLYAVAKAAEKIVSQGKAEEYYAIDKQYDNSVVNAKVEILNQEKTTHQLVIALVLAIFIVVGLCGWLYIKTKHKALIDRERTIDQLQNEIENQQFSSQSALDENLDIIQGLNKSIEERKKLEQTLRNVAEDRVKTMRQLLEIKYQCGNNIDTFAKRVNEALLLNKKSREDCLIIIDMANQLYCNIVDNIGGKCLGLNFNDKLLIAFACLEFSAIETMAFMSMVSSEAVYSARHRLAIKLGATNLYEYVKEIKRNLVQR